MHVSTCITLHEQFPVVLRVWHGQPRFNSKQTPEHSRACETIFASCCELFGAEGVRWQRLQGYDIAVRLASMDDAMLLRLQLASL